MTSKVRQSKTSATAKKSVAPRRGHKRPRTKKQVCLALLERSKGAGIADLRKATGWQAHSVRGFLSGTVRKMEGVRLISEVTDGGGRRYRIELKKAS